MAVKNYSWIFKVLLDLFLIFVVYLPWIILQTQQPAKRGFFCDEATLAYPFKESTVPSSLYVTLSIIVPILTIILLEYISYRIEKKQGSFQPIQNEANVKACQISIGNHQIPKFVIQSYSAALPFLLGAVINQTVTNIAKYSLGRLRPHFFAVCKPDYTLFSCLDSYGQPQYISDYICLGTHERQLKQMRLSFPSGHSSLSTYSAVFMVFYLHARIIWKHLDVLRTVLQAVLLFGAAGVCVTRISDYKHHWSDVIAGVLLGIIVAFFVSVYIAKFFHGPNIQRMMEIVKIRISSFSNKYDLPTITSSPHVQNIHQAATSAGPRPGSSNPQHMSDSNQHQSITPLESVSVQHGAKPNISTGDDFTGSGALY